MVASARKFSLFGLLVATALASAPSRAEPDASDPDTARRAKIAVRVGARTMTVGELEDRLATIPPFQAVTLGATRDEIVHAYVDQVVVRELLLSTGAEERGLDKTLPTSFKLARARSSATLRAIHAQIPPAVAISQDDVRKYYDDNRSRFDAPERINLWRIVCKTEGEAASVLDAAKREPTIAKYNDLAREHSVDKATNMRGGNLGFVTADGTSNEAGFKVDPAIVRAAQGVKDGELVPRPVAEGAFSAVVWRRATVPASHRSIEDASAQIRTSMYRERIEAADKALGDRLRAEKVKDVAYDKLAIIELPPFDAGVSLPHGSPWASSKPPAAPPPKASPPKAPPSAGR